MWLRALFFFLIGVSAVGALVAGTTLMIALEGCHLEQVNTDGLSTVYTALALGTAASLPSL
jgi:hypothetical protein